MQSWIFQGNPDLFDIDGYLAAGLPRITWLVRQNAKKVAVGDEVFIWRSAGSSRGKEARPAGIVAHATVASLPWTGPDHQESDRYWHDRQGATAEEPRVWLMVESVADAGKVLRRDDLKSDSALASLSILKQPAGTNFLVTGEEAVRLRSLWVPISNPVQGLLAAEVLAARFADEVQRNRDKSLSELEASYAAKGKPAKPERRIATAEVFVRDAEVIAIARKRAGDRCEVPGCTYEPFMTEGGVPYVEVHHIVRLADGGDDTPANVACLCPTHHRELHHGEQAHVLRAALMKVRGP